MINSFDNLVNVLRENGYDVEITKEEIYDFAYFVGKGVMGGFATEHDENHLEVHYYYNGIVTADNAECWNKPRQCPLKLRIPSNEDEMEHLLNRLAFWGSTEGYEASNDFGFDESSLDL